MLLWYKKSSFVPGGSEMKGRKLPSGFSVLHRSHQHRLLCSAWQLGEEAAAQFLGTQPWPAVWRRQGPGFGCSSCWISLHLFKVFGMEAFLSPPRLLGEAEQSCGKDRADPSPQPQITPCLPAQGLSRSPGRVPGSHLPVHGPGAGLHHHCQFYVSALMCMAFHLV